MSANHSLISGISTTAFAEPFMLRPVSYLACQAIEEGDAALSRRKRASRQAIARAAAAAGGDLSRAANRNRLDRALVPVIPDEALGRKPAQAVKAEAAQYG